MKRHLLLAGLCGLGLVACSGPRDESEERPSVATLYELDLRKAYPEQEMALFGDGRKGLLDGLMRLEELRDEPLAKGLFVRLGPLSGRFGDLADWSAAFEAWRAKKKPVHCHFDTLDNLGAALASHCDRVSMTPSGTLDLVGVAAQLVHGRKLLETLGVRAELLQIGKYKGAAEPFTRDEPTPELLESINGLLNDLDATLRSHLSAGGKRTSEQVQALIDGGPYTSDAAKTQGLVNALTYDDEARALAKKTVGAAAVRSMFRERPESLSLRELLALFSGDDEDKRSDEPRLAVAYLVGEISDGDSSARERGASEPFVKAMRRFADDTRVKALVLRIESPGGSALASDRMWHAVRRVAARKPVVVSIGDMAASGGYYVASAGSHILASEGSVVGSIGVVGGKMVLADLADKAGVHVTSLPRAKNAGWLSALEPFSPAERGRLEAMLSSTYDLFLDRVSIGRKRSVEQLLPGAEGRVMGGERAKALGLVDELGGLGRAVQLARERGKLSKSSDLVVWPEAGDPLQALGSLVGARQLSRAAQVQALLEADPAEVAGDIVQGALVHALSHGSPQVATTLPFTLVLR